MDDYFRYLIEQEEREREEEEELVYKIIRRTRTDGLPQLIPRAVRKQLVLEIRINEATKIAAGKAISEFQRKRSKPGESRNPKRPQKLIDYVLEQSKRRNGAEILNDLQKKQAREELTEDDLIKLIGQKKLPGRSTIYDILNPKKRPT
jgi:hypothetical protein